MNRAIQINRKAFIALLNQQRRREVVDFEYVTERGVTRLVLIFDTGERSVFRGLQAA
jgi:hypothetical protein